MLKNYLFLEATTSICSECQKRVSAKIILEDDKIFILKNCLEHGVQKELMEEDSNYYFHKRKYDKPGTLHKSQTKIKKGCPFDCGLCPNHEQHTCIGLIEITNRCNLKCPTCYANSDEGEFLSLSKIEKMMDFYMQSEDNQAEILQISGGEPTLHPEIIDILKLARDKNFKYIMLNTNGLRLAEEEKLAKEIADVYSAGGFEIYLQFDSLSDQGSLSLRGQKTAKTRQKAIENLAKYDVPITLVATIIQGKNDEEIGEIVKFGLEQKNIRGVNFQPVAFFGRQPKQDRQNRITLSGILQRIEKQTDKIVRTDDFIPLPCDVDRIAITYLSKKNNQWKPVTRTIEMETYLPAIDNTMAFNLENIVQKNKKKLFKCNGTGGCIKSMGQISQIIDPKIILKSKTARRKYVNENFFRITVTSFVDIYNFDMKSVKKDCIHIITPDLKKMPFSTYNMFYRK
jgi:uncharacterized radical SAM superfamily Fe-S cluster-containing enzyme